MPVTPEKSGFFRKQSGADVAAQGPLFHMEVIALRLIEFQLDLLFSDLRIDQVEERRITVPEIQRGAGPDSRELLIHGKHRPRERSEAPAKPGRAACPP